MQRLIREEIRRRKAAKSYEQKGISHTGKMIRNAFGLNNRPILQDEIEYPNEEFTFKLNLPL
jgi:hypothetical protein